jgi:hypothetical protein
MRPAQVLDSNHDSGMDLMSRRSALLGAALLIGSSVVVAVPAAGAPATQTPVLAYVKYRTSALVATDIYIAHVDGSGAVRRFLDASGPTVSPDGTKIAFWRGSTLWTANTDGSAARALGTFTSPQGVSWSPDDTRIVVGLWGHGLVIVNVATKAVTAIPNSSGESSPQWSPDGTLIMSVSGYQVLQRPDGSSRVARAGARTGKWSPDGTEVLSLDAATNLDIVNLLSGATTLVWSLFGDLSLTALAWGGRDPYVGVVFDVPWLPTPYFYIDRLDRDQRDPTDPSGLRVADNALYPSVGGLTPDDVNGTPPAVSGLAAAVSPSFVHLSWTAPASTPDFAGVEIRYALGSTPPATVTDGLDGGRLITTSRDLGPLAPDQDVAISVFSRDWTGHVGPAASTIVTTPHLTATTLTAAASPPDIVYGHSSTITATLTRTYDHAPLSLTPVTIATRHTNTTDPFTDRTTILTDATGKLSYLQIPGIGYDYQLRYAGDTDNAAVTATTRIRVAHRVTETLDHASAPAGSYVHLTATVAPSYPDGKTYLQKFTTRAITLGPHNTGATSKVTYTIKAPAKGTKMKYRVAVPSGGSYIAGYGTWLTITGT